MSDVLIKTLGRWQSDAYQRYIRTSPQQLACHAKIGLPKIGPAGPILAKNLPKVVPWTTYAAKIGPPCQFRSPSLLFPILHYRAIPLGTCIGSYSYS